MLNKFSILKRAIIGEVIKCKSNLNWNYTIRKLSKLPKGQSIPLIVSLTSYGDRVSTIVPYTIMSLFRQTRLPERIILWLDSDKWNYNNLPSKLKDLEKLGLKVAFCKDIRSYTKLVPALTLCKKNVIVTVDDDLYYSSNFLEEIYSQHLSNPKKIITLNFCYPKFIDTEIAPYREWKEFHLISENNSFSPMLIFPQGFGGVLYPPDALHEDVTKEELFLKFAPYADDIWFYIMGILKGTEKQCVVNSKTKYYFLDLFRQIRTRDRLHDLNVGESKNDLQLKALLSHYNLSLKDYE